MAVLGLHLSGRMDMKVSGAIGEKQIFDALEDVHTEWWKIAALAWRGYELLGRGAWWLNVTLRTTGFAPTAAETLPIPAWEYCQLYNPLSDVVIVLFNFTVNADPNSVAVVWLRPDGLWQTPPSAWQQLDPGMQDEAEIELGNWPFGLAQHHLTLFTWPRLLPTA